jgi:hypothetical protein
MAKKLFVAFAILALFVAVAGTVPGVPTYRITLQQAAVLNGTELKAGDYRLTLGDSKVTLVLGKQTFVVNAKIESGTGKKFDTTVVRYSSAGDKAVIDQIRLGGTRTIIRVP